MTIKDTYTVKITRTEDIEVTVTDATEEMVWDRIIFGWVDNGGLTRADYDEMADEDKAKFIAERAVALGTELDDFVETTGTQMTIFEIAKGE